VAAEGLDFSECGLLLLVGDCPIRQLVLCEKDFGWVALWGLDPEVVGSLWLMASTTWRKITSAEGLHDLGRRACPFESNPRIYFITEERHRKPQSGFPSSWRLLVAPTWLPFYGQPQLAC
jgi:hypothetical protein